MTAPAAVSFTVPLAPRGCARHRAGQGRFYKDPETAHFQTAMGHIARATMRGRELLIGPVELTVTSILPVPPSWSRKKREAALAGEIRPVTKPDWDNLGKQTDALNGIVWGDDAQVVDGRSVKFYGATPSMHVTVRQLSQPLNSRSGGKDQLGAGHLLEA